MFTATGPRTNQRFLPYISISRSDSGSSITELEAAAVFCFVEMERVKGGGVIMKQPEEKIAFIAKMGYPLFVFPWKEKSLIFDGLNQTNYTFFHSSIPDANALMETLKRAAKTAETYSAFLSDETDLDLDSSQERSLVLSGLLREPDFLAEMESYLQEAAKSIEEDYKIGLLPQTIDEATIASEIREIDNLQISLQTNVDILSRCIKFLNKTTLQIAAELRAKARETMEEYASKIELEEKTAAPRIAQLRDEYDFRVSAMVKAFEKENLPVQREKTKLEKCIENALARLERNKKEAKTHSDKGHAAAEHKCKEKISRTRKEISEIENQLKQINKTLKTIEEKRLVESIKLKEELETGVIEARKKLHDLEAMRDAKILIHKQEIEKMERQTKIKGNLVDRTIKALESDIDLLSTLSAKRELKQETGTLYYVPFYLACFEAESKKRFMIIPPSAMSTVNILTKLKGALRRTRIKNLLIPRFKTVRAILDSVPALMNQNPGFERETSDLGAKNNILSTSELREKIKIGLTSLKAEGWLSDKELNSISQKIV